MTNIIWKVIKSKSGVDTRGSDGPYIAGKNYMAADMANSLWLSEYFTTATLHSNCNAEMLASVLESQEYVHRNFYTTAV